MSHHQERHGSLLQINFEAFIKNEGPVDLRLDPNHDSSLDYIEKVQLVKKDNMVCCLASGNILIKQVQRFLIRVMTFTGYCIISLSLIYCHHNPENNHNKHNN